MSPSVASRQIPVQSDPNLQQQGPVPPELLQRMWNFFAGDKTGLGAAPNPIAMALPGVSVLPSTVPLFTKALEEAPVVTGHPLIDKAISFLSTRYPRFATQVPTLAAEKGQLPWQISGIYQHTSPEGPFAMVNPYAAKFDFNDLSRFIDTLAHEMTHARQAAKGGAEALSKEAKAGIPYFEQEIEQLARKGGGTAKEAYSKYLQLLHPEPPPSWTSVSNIPGK